MRAGQHARPLCGIRPAPGKRVPDQVVRRHDARQGHEHASDKHALDMAFLAHGIQDQIDLSRLIDKVKFQPAGKDCFCRFVLDMPPHRMPSFVDTLAKYQLEREPTNDRRQHENATMWPFSASVSEACEELGRLSRIALSEQALESGAANFERGDA